MPSTKTLTRSFSGGEMSPAMFGRIDDPKYQAGAEIMRNFISTPQGPIVNRPGFAYVDSAKHADKKARLIPFTYSTTQTMIIEMGAGYFRFHTYGQTLLCGTPAAYNGSTAYSVGSLCSNAGVNYYCILATTGHAPPNATYWYPLTGTTYEIPNPYSESDLFDIDYEQSNDVITFAHTGYPPKELRRYGAIDWRLIDSTFSAQISPPTGVTAAPTCTAAKYTYYYRVTSIADDDVSESIGSTSASCSGNLLETGGYNTISWSDNGAKRFRVYKLQGGIYGYIGETEDLSIVDDNISADTSTSPPIYDNVFASSGNYPRCVSYSEQRKCFGGSINDPRKVWMTRTGTENNMSYSIPLKDTDRIAFTIAAREANTVRHIIPLGQLLLLTSSTEWRVASVNTDALTPESISTKPQSYIGASTVRPVIVNNTVVFAADRGGHLRELGYNWQSNGYITGDLSLRAAHLFDGYDIKDMAHSKAPDPIIYAVSTSGKLLALTYIPEQQIGAWTWFDTDGDFESCAVVAEGSEDYLYVIVKRTIGGSTVRYVERLSTRRFETLEDSFFVDCGASYDGKNSSIGHGSVSVTVSGGTSWDRDDTLTITSSSAIFSGTSDVNDAIIIYGADDVPYRFRIAEYVSSTVVHVLTDQEIPSDLHGTSQPEWYFARDRITGLSWLEGKTVSILADGSVLEQAIVSGGAVSLDRASVKVHVGLPYYSDLKTLPMALQMDALGQGRQKNVDHVWLRVYQTSGIFIGPDEDNLVSVKQRSDEGYGIPTRWKSDEVDVTTLPAWSPSGAVFIRQADPLPLNIVSLTIQATVA